MTHYGIRSAALSRKWATAGAVKWTDNEREALRVDTVEEAVLYACEFMNLDMRTFTVEPLPITLVQPLWRTRQ
jgi:hypothetical protein